jgi:hypothetical protein
VAGRAITVQFMPLRPDLEGVIAAKARAAGFDRMNNQAAIDMLQPGGVLVVESVRQRRRRHHRRRQPVLRDAEGPGAEKEYEEYLKKRLEEIRRKRISPSWRAAVAPIRRCAWFRSCRW